MAKRYRHLTRENLIDFHQLVGYAKIMADKKAWPESIHSRFNKQAVQKAWAIYREYDKCIAPEIRDEIFDKLTERGMTVQKDVWINNTWRADIKENKTVIMITGKSKRNEKGWLKGREYMKSLGIKENSKEVIWVDVDKWKGLNVKERKLEIEEMIKKMVKASIRT